MLASLFYLFFYYSEKLPGDIPAATERATVAGPVLT